jgi:hypothetical protein
MNMVPKLWHGTNKDPQAILLSYDMVIPPPSPHSSECRGIAYTCYTEVERLREREGAIAACLGCQEGGGGREGVRM